MENHPHSLLLSLSANLEAFLTLSKGANLA